MIQESKKTEQKANALIFSGMVGFPVAAVLVLANFKTLDIPLTISIYCFSMALPINVLHLIIYYLVSESKYSVMVSGSKLQKQLFQLPLLVSSIAVLVGAACLFLHFSLIVGLLFITCSVYALIVGTIGIMKFYEEEAKKQ